MIKVLVADDHAVVRRGLMQIVDDRADMAVAGEASTGRQVLQAVQDQDYDVLVLDIAMPEGGGLEVLDALRSLRPGLPVLILSIYSEQQYALRALKAGAAGYLTKEGAPDELIEAIRKVAAGGKYVTPALAEKLVVAIGDDTEKPPHEALSNREYQVMCLLARGQTVSEIAGELALSVKTISTYRSRVLAKLRLKNTAEVIRYAIERGLVE